MSPRSETELDQRFVLEREVGRGGIGIVYRAFDSRTQQHVALKLIAARGADPAEEARFLREGRLLSELSHPHIVRSLSSGLLDDGTPYVAMEWLEGEDLAARMDRASLPLRDALEITRQIASALEAAHAAEVVHRDIKPSNVFLLAGSAAPFVKVVDFGVAADRDIRLTRTGTMIGTPAYMAPEQARGDASIDARVDLYSLGATLFELIAGRPVHEGKTPVAVLARLVTMPAPRLGELVPELPHAIDDLVARLLASKPTDRPSSAKEVVEELERISRELGDVDLAQAPRPLLSEAPSTQGERLVTAIVALGVGEGETQASAVRHLLERGADAIPLGQDSLIARLGAQRALGDEASQALALGHWLAARGARVGIATGRTKVDLTRPSGKIVDLAAALAHRAEPTRALADSTTAELARSRYTLHAGDEGSFFIEDPLPDQRLDSRGTPFVGREGELARALDAHQRCVEDESPIVVTLTGPPGIGKSRLGRELLARISTDHEDARVAIARGEAFARGHALGTACDLVRALLELKTGATLDDARAALERAWSLGSKDDVQISHVRSGAPMPDCELLTRLLADAPLPEDAGSRGARDALWISLTELVLRLTTRGPVVLVLEDMQWADAESVRWLDHALGRASRHRLFVVGMTRPSFWSEEGSRFAGRDHIRIELRPISRRAVRAIAKAVLGEDAEDERIDEVASQAGGSPLFAEELARLFSLGRCAEVAVTIDAAIQASLDSLDPRARMALTRASVFGATIWDRALEALGIPGAEPLLESLIKEELLVEQGPSRFEGARELTFKHGLVRDVAYASLGSEEKTRLHELAGRWLAEQGEDAAVVASHFDLGGAQGEASMHWERAARHSLAAHALGDAVRMAESALMHAADPPVAFARASLLDEAFCRLDPRAADRESAVRALEESAFDEKSRVLARGARARYDDARGSGEDVSARLASVLADATRLGLLDEQARVAAALAARHAFAGALPEAEAAALTLLDLSSQRELPAAAIDAWQTLAVVRQTRGEVASALEARRNAVSAARIAGLKEREAMLTVNVGFALTTLGAEEEARSAIEEGVALAKAIGSAGTVRQGLMVLLGWSAIFGTDASLDPDLAELRQVADAAASAMWTAPDRTTLGILFYRGAELLRRGEDVARARALLAKAAGLYRETGHHDVLPVALGMWAEATRLSGEATLALEIAREATALLDRGAPSLLNEAPVFLALHDACMDLGDLHGARDAIARALPYLERRVAGLSGTPYVRSFLTKLPHNAGLFAAAEAYRLPLSFVPLDERKR